MRLLRIPLFGVPLTAVMLLLLAPKWETDLVLESHVFDSRSDCFVVGDRLRYRSLGDALNIVFGGHSRGFSSWVVNRHAYRVGFLDNAPSASVQVVASCAALLGESFVLSGTQVDTTLRTSRGDVVVDRQPDRGKGAVRRLLIRVPWEGDFQVDGALAARLEDSAVLYDAGLLVNPSVRGWPELSIDYDVYDYRTESLRHYHISRADLARAAADGFIALEPDSDG